LKTTAFELPFHRFWRRFRPKNDSILVGLLFIPTAFAAFLGLKVVRIHRFEYLNKPIRTPEPLICVAFVRGFVTFATVVADH